MHDKNTSPSSQGKHPRAKKKFGQHFLVHQSQIERIIHLLDHQPGMHVLEIGPGPGTLTIPLVAKGVALTLVETDAEMIQHLAEQDFQPKPRMIQADFLTLDLAELIARETHVVSNLPYNVSVPITAALLRRTHHIPQMVLMYQKEVAMRIAAAAGTKTYGQFSVVCQCLYDVKRGFDLSPGAFSPPPKVWSRVLVFQRRENPILAVQDLDVLEKLLNLLFGQRRKMVGSILRKHAPRWANLSALIESYSACGFDPQWRPEVLQPDDYARWIGSYRQLCEPQSKG